MKKLVEYKLADTSSVWIELDEPPPAGVKAVSKIGDATEKAKEVFEDVLSKIKPTTAALAATLREMGPDEATVEFGVKLGLKTGVIIASADKEVNFVFKLTWKRSPEPTQP